jgi:hypothetical protein
VKGKKPLKNWNGRDFLSESEYREHLEIYGEKVASIFSAISPEYSAGENTGGSNLNDGKAKDTDMGFSNSGLR